MYTRMLVPLDGSKLAESVLAYASQIADKLGMEIVFLHVCDERGSTSEFMCRAYIDRVTELSGAGKKAMGEIVTGDPARAILDFAKKNRIDLTLIATHGHSGLGAWATGSTAHRVLVGSPTPVLMVRSKNTPNVKSGKWPENILVPLDGSTLAETVLPHIEALAKQGNTDMEVRLLRVCDPPVLLADYPEAVMKLTWEEHIQKATAASEKTCSLYLDDVEKRLKAAGVRVHSVEATLGDDIADSITKYLSKHPCDLIAMSTHGKSGANEWPYGRIVDKLIKTTNVPLFLVRPEARSSAH